MVDKTAQKKECLARRCGGLMSGQKRQLSRCLFPCSTKTFVQHTRVSEIIYLSIHIEICIYVFRYIYILYSLLSHIEIYIYIYIYIYLYGDI